MLIQRDVTERYSSKSIKVVYPFSFQVLNIKGLTLLELLIALFVFTSAGIGIHASYLSSSRLIQDTANHMRAIEDLGDMMEHIQGTPFDDLFTFYPDGVIDGGKVQYQDLVGGYTLQDEHIVVTYSSQTKNRIEIVVTVNWVYSGRKYSRSLSTMRTDT